MSKPWLLIISLAVILGTAYFVFVTNFKAGVYKPGSWYEGDRAIDQAQRIYQTKKDLGESFESGPCLSNDLSPGWVADIAHSPRQSIDDLAQNQCPAFAEGRASHFVELDPNGNLIRVQ